VSLSCTERVVSWIEPEYLVNNAKVLDGIAPW
jgi:hypothetical protein